MRTKSTYYHKISIPFSFKNFIYILYTFKYGLEGKIKIILYKNCTFHIFLVLLYNKNYKEHILLAENAIEI